MARGQKAAAVEETTMEDTTTPTTTDEVDKTVAGNVDNILVELKGIYDNFTTQYKDLTKKIKTLRKEVAKIEKKRVKRKGSTNSGIQKKVPISDELRDFLGLEDGTLIARTEVNTMMSKYIKENGLQDPTNGQKLVLDCNDAGKKLKALLQPDDDVVLTYFKMQTYLKKHYPTAGTTTAKKVPAPAPTETPSAEEKTDGEDSTKRRVRAGRRVVRRTLKEAEA